MTDRFRVASTLAHKLEELGVSPADVLRRAALPEGLFEQERILVSTEEFFALYRGLAEASRDPAIGLKLGAEARMERYSPTSIIAVCARSLRDALVRMARYKQLTCPEELRVVVRAGEAHVQFRWPLAHEAEPTLLADQCFSRVTEIARRGTDGLVSPKRVELRGPARGRKMYEAHFGCPATFAAQHNTLVFAGTDLDRPFLTHNPDLYAMVASQLEAELSRSSGSKALGEQVKVVLKNLLASRRPGIGDVAKEMRLSARTLQRRLAEEGETFQQLLQAARRELAHHYLLHSALELNETAYILGYEDSHSFFRAFQGWEGVSPGEWRRRHARGARSRSGAAAGAPREAV